MTQVIKFLLFASSTLLLAGCFATSPKTDSAKKTDVSLAQNQASKPVWITSLPSRPGYAYGVSSAEIYGSSSRALEDAKTQATAELLSGIRVEISSQTDYTKSSTMEFQGNFKLQQSFDQKISSKVPQVELSGLTITETWVDEKNKQAWALAELNTSQATHKLLERVNQLDNTILERGMKTSGSKLDRIRYIQPSILELAERKQAIEHLNFLSAASKIDSERSKNIEFLNNEISSLLSSIGVMLKSSDSQARNLEPTLAKSLTDLGFNLTTNMPDLYLEISASSSLINSKGLYIVDTQGNGQIKTPSGRTLQVIKAKAREVSGNQEVASSKANETLGKELAEQLFETLYLNL